MIPFAVCLLIIFIIELAVGIAAAVYKNDFEDALKDNLKKSMKNYLTDRTERVAWDDTQSKLMCCGTDSSNDWFKNQPSIPISCCKETSSNQTVTICIRGYYETGCLDKLKSKIIEKATVLIGVGIGIAFIQLLGIILACLLAITIKRESGK